MSRFLCVLPAAVLFSCAHQTPEAPPSTAPSSSASTQVAWKDMDGQQRARYMVKVVTPAMAEMFRAFKPDEFTKFDCATCHGKDARERGFKMPNPSLPPLPASPKVFMATFMKEKPHWVQFMGEKVTPVMAQMLGRKAFDPSHPDPQAFSCNGCHTLTGSPEATE